MVVENVPYVDVTAALSADKKRLTVFCVNRSLTQDVPAHISLGSFKSRQKASVTQLYGVSRYVMNDEVEPNRGTPLVSSVDVTEDKPVTLVLPHEGVTVLRFEAR